MEIFIKSFGAKLTKSEGMFKIETQNDKQTIPVGIVERIHLHEACMVTTDAVLLALENDIEVVLYNKRGTPKGYFWHGNNFSIAHIRQGQALFSVSSDAHHWIVELLTEKLNNQKCFLNKLSKHPDQLVQIKYEQCEAAMQNAAKSGIPKSKLRSVEARFARFYFAMLSCNLPEPYRFEGRSKRPAKDPFNAALNYAYALLYTKVEAALWRAGLDPYLGIFHANEHRTQALTFDMIEPFRPWADETVFLLFKHHTFTPESFEHTEHGVWLTDAGKNILIPFYTERMHQKIDYRGKRMSRTNHIYSYAQAFASKMKDFYHTHNKNALSYGTTDML
ncbi:MAG: CRISPR-associated endonuclease Cas1 [Chitinophagales bacterium]|nr:CRISPR-associated endonuclease Cas1 [Chitinophagales bacterium]MDW8420009.1 CRISPR-associated endonuclease Cas1 [Chitinophagales bacterium]